MSACALTQCGTPARGSIRDDHSCRLRTSRDYARFHLAHHDPQIEVATADSLASAIHRANAMPALDVVVLDMMMPDMDGLLGLRGFRQSRRHEVPIAVTSVSLNALTLRDILAAGGAGYLPFDISTRKRITADCRW